MTAIGKSSVIKELVSNHQFAFSISTTTRLPRPGEIHGVHYHFVNHTEFQELLEQGQILEHTYYLGSYYGTSRLQLEKLTGQKIIFDLSPYSSIKELLPEMKWILLHHQDRQEIRNRLLQRDASLDPRIIEARLAAIDAYDPSAFEYDATVDVTNKAVGEIVCELLALL